MVEDYTVEELNKLINECRKKYEKLGSDWRDWYELRNG